MSPSGKKQVLVFVCLVFLTSIAFGQCGSAVLSGNNGQTEKGFFLRDGDVYVIYGDSITDGAVYPRTIENYVLTRFPNWNVTFYNLGWGGDVAGNLFRLERDVLPLKPTAFTECMGMNDAGYGPINPGRLDTYINAYRQMVPLLQKVNPDVRIAFISPVPFENKFYSGRGDGCYAQTLRIFSQAKRDLAQELGVGFIDLNTGYGEKMGLGKVIYPDFILSGDGVHPNEIGQTIMAQTILKGMNAPSLIASTALDVSGNTPAVTDTTRCQVKDLKMSDQGELSFERIAEALPCPVEASGDTAKRFLDVADFNNEINRDILTVKGLTGKAYELKIDGVPIDVYSNQDLLHGVNISLPMKGPLWDQAKAVMEATQERQNAHYTKWRGVWLNSGGPGSGQYDLSDTKRIEELDSIAQAAIKKQHQLNQPKWMTFTLTPVESKPVEYPAPVTFADLVGTANQPPTLQPLDWVKAKVKQIDLRPVVNRAFADDVEGDGKGGWSDQGPGNDLSSLPVGNQVLAGVPFDIIEPEKNSGNSMLVLSRRAGVNVPASAVIPLDIKAKTLTFLHAAAWASEGNPPLTITFHYANGLSTQKTLGFGSILCDWWNPPAALPCSIRAWKGNNPSATIAVFYTPVTNPFPDETIKSVEFSVPDGAPWVYGLIAITALE